LDLLLKYITLEDPNVRFVVVAIVLLGAVSGMVGSFNFLRKKTLVGETVAHSMLPGVLIAFLLSGVKSPIIMILGAALSGWMSIWLVDYITQKSKIKGDSALAIVLSSFFGLGIVLLTMIQSRFSGNQSGLDHYIFGNAAAMTPEDSTTFAVVCLVVFVLVMSSYLSIKATIFNSDYAQSIGISRKKIDILISILTILTISVGIKAVGIVMMSALLIIPPTAARFWTDRLVPMLIISGCFGALGGWLGSFISYYETNMPTGPLTIVCVSIIAFVSMMFAPKKGIVYQRWNKLLLRRRINEENLLKAAVQNEVRGKGKLFDRAQINTRQYFEQKLWNRTINRLKNKGFVYKVHTLQRRMQMSVHLVHDEAETMEHFLTPEIEEEILGELGLCSRFNPLLEIHEIIPDPDIA